MGKTHVQKVRYQCENTQICPGDLEAEWRYLDKPGATRGGFLGGMMPSLTPKVKYMRNRGNEDREKNRAVWVPVRSEKP